MKTSLTLLFVILLAVTAFARIINVPADYATIQAGIDASVTGDTVLVASGEYRENPQLVAKNILLTSSSAPLECCIRGTLTIGPDVDSTCKVRGFGISSPDRGPSIGVNTSSPIIEANILQNNPWFGSGAVTMLNSNGIIRGNIIRSNHGYQGGGIEASGFPAIENNIITDNLFTTGDAYLRGGGIFIRAGIIRGNIISHNTMGSPYGGASGGGIFKAVGSPFYMYNNTIVENNAWSIYGPSSGGGISIDIAPDDHDIVIKNNIFAFNAPNGLSVINSDSLIWDYNLVYGNDTYDYGGIRPGPHDIQADPLFVDTAAGDYHLLPNSPCIDAGDPSFPLDPDSTRCDIGAYFFDQGVGINDGTPTGPYNFTLQQNYPNPFNSETIISYSLEKDARVTLRVMSITGQLVKTLMDNVGENSGEHCIIWDGTDKRGQAVSTGIYFYELYVDSYRESKAMILIR
jgi:hypothetical protein